MKQIKICKRLVKIRTILDIDVDKGKQHLTNLIKELEEDLQK